MERELLMPQLMMGHIARRAVRVAIVAAGILVILLVFSRQAHARAPWPRTTATHASPACGATPGSW
jgi:hypothetical protein